MQQLTNVPGANIVLAGPFTLGYYTNASSYDLDEFVLSLRAYSAPEIMALSMAPPAGAGDYDSDIASQCGSIVLDSTGGRPSLGNSSFGLTMTGPATPTLYVAVLGFSRCTYGGVLPLPFDRGSALPSAAGCWLLSDNFTNIAVTGPTGSAALPMPVPNNQMLSGLGVFSQAVGIDLTTSQVSMSNGFVMGLGF